MRKFGLFALLMGLGLTVGCEPAKKADPVTPPAPAVDEKTDPATDGAATPADAPVEPAKTE
jgi:hypothetical protein